MLSVKLQKLAKMPGVRFVETPMLWIPHRFHTQKSHVVEAPIPRSRRYKVDLNSIEVDIHCNKKFDSSKILVIVT